MRTRLTAGDWIAILSIVGALLVWAVRLESRVEAQGQRYEDALTQFRGDLTYIRERVDQIVDREAER